MKTIKQMYSSLNSSRDIFIKDSQLIERIGFSTKGQVKKTLSRGRFGEEVDSYITLCPFYDNEGGIKGDYDSFQEVGDRYQNKLKASLEVVDFLKDYFNLKLKFILADQMVLVNTNYDTSMFSNDIKGTLELYNREIKDNLNERDFSIQTFSDIGLQLNNICNIDEERKERDILGILDFFGVNYEKNRFSLQIIINSFGITGAYYLIKGYLEETKQFLDIFKEKIIINTEAVGPLNSLYTVGDNKLDSENMLVRIKI